ncbi:tryptophan dimethylallyltransferase family protein [Streptomyces olivoreticuli]|uniref:tryptophan dimethylallyltransferase family protein n=1 Tax=Streptomyces olivoreticuli TaxID=68246 RepID=UPI000E279E6C|nr:tryptophan dimethylallyltransferase family protein [Streptomyces olivoreticuli]
MESAGPGTGPQPPRPSGDFTPDTGVIAEMTGRPTRFDSDRYRPTDTYAEVACDKVLRAYEGLGTDGGDREPLLAFLRDLTDPWGELPVGIPPEDACWVSIDGMPLETSVAWAGRKAGVRLSLESPRGPAKRRMEDGMALTRRLAGRPGVSVDPCLRVEDLFTDDDPQGYFTIAHAVAWVPGGHPRYKIFLNPAVRGREQAAARTEEAMVRLGLERPWRALTEHLGGAYGPEHEPAALAMDLVPGDDFRVQVYLAHSGVSADAIDAKSAVAADHVPGSFAHALRSINGADGTPEWKRKPPVTAFSFGPGKAVPGATLYVPMIPVHESDAAARERVAAFLRSEGVDPSSYVSVLDAISDRPLPGSRTQNFISYRGGDSPRFSVYLAPGVYREV